MLLTLARLRSRLLRWYDAHRRDMPWRIAPAGDNNTALDPYHVLLSETMLQQTQVAAVIPYYKRFLARFPTVRRLAEADEQEVLRLWQGLGYYSRARNLQAAARAIVERFDGRVPETVGELLSLPGVGRYTAGAVASIAFERRAPILDGNVMRVLCRLDAIRSDPRDRQTQRKLWARAEELLPRRRCGDFNSALMELGALVCTPRRPQCLVCPVREHCEALAQGLQDLIPAKRQARPTPLEKRWTFCVRHAERWLIEQRPSRGRWAGMWQFITVPAPDGAAPTARTVREHTGLKTRELHRLGQVTHGLTHRRYEFEVYRCIATDGPTDDSGTLRRWVTLSDLDRYPLPRPHVKIVGMLSEIAD